MKTCFALLALCLISTNNSRNVQSEEFMPVAVAVDDKLDAKPNSRNLAQQPDFGYNDVVNNDDDDDDVNDDNLRSRDVFRTDGDVSRTSLSRQTIDKDGSQALLNAGVQERSSNNGVDEGSKPDQSINLIDVLKPRPEDINPFPNVQSLVVQSTNSRSRISNRNSELTRRTDLSPMRSRPIKPSAAAKSRCPECKEVLESIHKDMQGLNQEMDTISRLIGAVLTQRNCSINELLPEHHWKLDGKCKDDMDTDNRVCAVSCATLLLHPETKKTPTGRAMVQLRLEPTPHHGVCATHMDGSTGSFVDLGDWAGSCVSQPERCSSGLSVTAWLKLDINRESNIAYILTSGDFDARSRGFVVLARYQEELGRNNIGLTVWLRDATYFWSAGATVSARRWCHIGFSWSRSRDLDLFIDGKRVTRNAIVTQDHSLPSPMTRLTIGNPPSVDKFTGSFAIADLSLYLVRLEEGDMLEFYRRESTV